MEEIAVEEHEPGEPPKTARFTGRWIVRPGSGPALPEEGGYEEYWGVAQTRRGQIAIYTTDPGGDWAELAIYASLDAAERSNCVPAEVVALVASDLGDERAKGLAIGRAGWWRGADGLIRLDI